MIYLIILAIYALIGYIIAMKSWRWTGYSIEYGAPDEFIRGLFWPLYLLKILLIYIGDKLVKIL